MYRGFAFGSFEPKISSREILYSSNIYFVASVEVNEYLGMIPELVDCDNSYNIDLNQIEDKLKANNKVAV